MSQSSILYRLQQTDSQLDQARHRLQEIAQILQDDLVVQQAKVHSENAQKMQQTAQKALRLAEDAVKTQNIKIETTEANLYGGKVRNPKELQELQHETAALKRYLETLEERQLEKMLAVEEADQALTEAQAALTQATARLSEQHAGLKGEQTTVKHTIERLEVERLATRSSISPDTLTVYEKLRQQRRGVAVAKISIRNCGACGSMLHTAVAQAAASDSQLAYCPTCGRILYAG